MFRGNLLYCSLCLSPLVLLLGATGKSLAPSSLQSLFRHLYTLMRSPQAFSSPGWTVDALSAFPHRRDALVPSSLWPFAGLSPVCPSLSYTEEPRTGHSAPGVASPVLSRGESCGYCQIGYCIVGWTQWNFFLFALRNMLLSGGIMYLQTKVYLSLALVWNFGVEWIT